MPTTETVLVVDDDDAILRLLADFLEAEGLRVLTAQDVSCARQTLAANEVDCLLLDVMMPGESGFDLCRTVRAENDIPILFLSARGEDADKLRGFGLGGDDYIVKSASPIEVTARVKAALRWSKRLARPSRAELQIAGLTLDLSSHEARAGGEAVALSPREFEILAFLAQRPHQVFTYDQLLDKFWDGVGDKHTVTVHIGRIREKIEPDPANPALLVNVWGVGYRFEG